ncbi:uncharacterized protein VTP21DRAFT_4160 [Calcarisporiella thermophila]|uniref:uncharacterized protein n=1 Tax=Calcarisporiella thermophila TaxID=911321 RepID=UPI0037434EF0
MAPPVVSQALEAYTKGTRVWFVDEREGWVSAQVTAKDVQSDRVRLVFTDEKGKETTIESTFANLEKTQFAELPPLRNPPHLETTDDLTNLSYLNEPAVLNAIKTRYAQRNIYTYSGIVLIAVNPFQRVNLYEPEIVQAYSGRRRGELEPHLFAIAEDAYRCMLREQKNQTIVVSGESGAGKTVSAKYIMRYFATADDHEKTMKKSTRLVDGMNAVVVSGMSEVEEQILATNPIMEAFGNAKTTRNDNSSRFGKYIEIQFDDGANIIGAKIRTYLLERSRLIYQPDTERNYHIFYQLCAGAPMSEKKTFKIKTYDQFHYLRQGGVATISGVDDAAEFETTQRALSTVGISVQLQWQIFRLLAALLHIGNIEITGRNDAMLAEDDPHLATATELLGINLSEFRKWIVRKQITTRSEKIVSNLQPAQAVVVRDSVAKYIYANLFDWLVGVINESLSHKDLSRVNTFIGVLDIYGFEHFKKNSFEQFCINYANEKLQQEFNQHVFKLEQEEYIRENIDWTFIEFSDNQPCIEMIEGKLGILSLLDEESRLPSGSDQGWCNKLIQHFSTPQYKKYFQKPRFANNAFTVSHYAHDVTYDTDGFLEKNRDTVPEEHLSLLQSTEFDFLKEVLIKGMASQPLQEQASKRMSVIAKKPTLGSIFKGSLINLMDTINSTNVHYIRCIKPNEGKAPWVFEPQMVIAQLRACGVLETIRISCAGYPSRWTFEEFADRYYMLVNSEHWTRDIRQLCTTILDAMIHDRDKYQVGATKLFFRAGQLAALERYRSERLHMCATVIQKNVRRYLCHRHYTKMREATIRLQRLTRRIIAQRKARAMREERAAIKIQKVWRGYAARKRYTRTKLAIIRIQSLARGRAARLQYMHLNRQRAASKIQRVFRGYLSRRDYQRTRKQIVLAQSCIRRYQARKQLKQLKQEARSVNHYKEVKYHLENKVVELTQLLTVEREKKLELAKRAGVLEAQVQSWAEKCERLDARTKELEQTMQKKTVPRGEWETLRAEKEQLHTSYQESLGRIRAQEEQIAQLNSEHSKLRDELEKIRKAQEQQMHQRQQERGADNATKIAALQKELAHLKAELATKSHAPPRRANSNVLYPDELRSSAVANAAAILESRYENGFLLKETPSYGVTTNGTQVRGKSPTGNLPPAPRRPRRNSSAEPYEISKGSKPRTSMEFVIKESAFNPKHVSTSFDHLDMSKILRPAGRRSPLEPMDGNPEDEIIRLLEEEEPLRGEILEGLIRTLKIPMPSVQSPASIKEVLFPAHVIGLAVTQMWRLGFLQESEKLLFNVMDTIQMQCLTYQGDEAVVPCAYWLSNTHELYSLICASEEELQHQASLSAVSGMRAFGWHDFEKLISTVKYEMQCLEDNIYHAWLKELKKRLNKMVIPAVIENQSLPGFITNDSGGRFLNKLLSGGSTQPTFKMDDLLNFLNRLWRAMKCYYLEPGIIQQVLGELLRLIGVAGFNDLLMRKNFCSWKRAMQIQYNITRIEEWCKSHGMHEGTVQLEHLMQATKLLQLKKATLQDLEIIYDVCWILTPMQIQKLISHYHVADYENPISSEILKAVATRVNSSDKSDALLLDTIPLEEPSMPFEIPEQRIARTPEKYLPSWLNLARLRKLTFLCAAQEEMQPSAVLEKVSS